MLITCLNCRVECTVDNLSIDTMPCPTCGLELSTRTVMPPRQVFLGESHAPDAETRDEIESAVVQPASDFVLPVRMGKYFIESLISQGGFAKVYLATDEHLGRRVALKIPRVEKFNSPAKLQQFLAEARTAAKLHHPGIVTIYDVGKFANGVHYIAMEYVAGKPLSQLMDAGRISIPRAVDLLIKVAETVHFANGQGFYHRDLKPGNILLDERGEPRVVDFGLAVHETVQDRLQGDVSGTPPYMSPEQFRGEVHQLDGRTDIWSLGVVLYELLTGRRPFKGDAKQVRDEVLNKAPKPPRQIDDQIPKELESICFKCLSKAVDDRYPTAKDLADELHAWKSLATTPTVAPDPIPPVPPPITSQPPHFRPRRTRLATILAGAALAVLLAVAVGLKSPRSEPLTSFDIDQRAIRDEWIPLLPADVFPLVWDETHATDNWHQSRQKVVVDCSGSALLSLGKTRATDFSVQILIGRSHWNDSNGQAGLFIGWQPIEDSEGRKGHRCINITVVSDKSETESIHRLAIRPWDVFDVADSPKPSILKNNRKTIRVPPPEPQNLLEIHVRRGKLTSAKWQNVDFSELLSDADFPAVSVAGEESQIGIINMLGSTSFSDVRFKLLDSIPNSVKGQPR